jgi:hypothetical protein
MMDLHRITRLFLSLAVGILLTTVIVILVRAQELKQDNPPVEPPELRTEMRGELLEHPGVSNSSPRDDASNQPARTTAGVRPPGNFDVILFGEDFEWGQRWSSSGLWHSVVGYLDISDPYSRNHSQIYSMWYGQNGTGDYDTGTRTTGSISTTQPIYIPNTGGSVSVSFWSWEQTEETGAGGCALPPELCNFDLRELYISGTLSTHWTQLWSTQSTSTVEGDWHQVVADISAYKGESVHLRFTFDSVDNKFNDNEGWYLDDIAIVQHDVNVPGYPLTDAWMQSFLEDHPDPPPDREIYLDRVGATGVTPWQITDDSDEQSAPAVAAHPVSGVPIVWTHSYTNSHGVPVGDVEYTVLNPFRAVATPINKVTNHSSATFPSVEDYSPVVSVNPTDGSSVIAWTNCLSYPVSYLTRVYNVEYVIRNATGGVVHGPIALTSNTDTQVKDYDPAVETFSNGNLLFAWRRVDYDTPLRDVFYTVLNREGAIVKAIGNLSGRNQTVHGIHMARLANGNILVVWVEDYLNVFYAVVNSNGTVIKTPTKLTSYASSHETEAWYAEALGMDNGNSIIAWTHFGKNLTAAQIRYAVLDSSYNVLQPPTMLPNAYNAVVNGPVSMVADGLDAAILTWPSISYPYLHLYYARLDHAGNVLKAPLIYRQTEGSMIYTTTRGYGVGGLSPFPLYLPLVRR